MMAYFFLVNITKLDTWGPFSRKLSLCNPGPRWQATLIPTSHSRIESRCSSLIWRTFGREYKHLRACQAHCVTRNGSPQGKGREVPRHTKHPLWMMLLIFANGWQLWLGMIRLTDVGVPSANRQQPSAINQPIITLLQPQKSSNRCSRATIFTVHPFYLTAQEG